MPNMRHLKTKATVALLDIDDTLIIGNPNIDPETDQITQIKKKLLMRKVLNLELISALQKANIKDIYLFTDMTFRMSNLLGKQALIEILNENGFIVHGIITPADCAWHLPQDQLRKFAESEFNHLPKLIDSLQKSNKNHEAQLLLTKLQSIEEYQQLIEFSKLENSVNPGRAFEETINAMYNPQEFKILYPHSYNAKFFADCQSIVEGLSHVKGKMFQHLIKNNPGKFEKFLVCDDRLDVLESIKQANDSLSTSVNAVTIYINNNSKKKSHNEQTKDRTCYFNQINASDVLNNACIVYKAHLEKYIKNERSNENLALAEKKLAVVKEMHETLGKTVGDEQLQAFREKFIEHQAILKKRNDRRGIWFLKIVATVLSLGIAAAFGIWKVEGREMIKNIEPLLPKPYQPSRI